jgi:hypothetical protein
MKRSGARFGKPGAHDGRHFSNRIQVLLSSLEF